MVVFECISDYLKPTTGMDCLKITNMVAVRTCEVVLTLLPCDRILEFVMVMKVTLI